jgi:hypothetical protein
MGSSRQAARCRHHCASEAVCSMAALTSIRTALLNLMIVAGSKAHRRWCAASHRSRPASRRCADDRRFLHVARSPSLRALPLLGCTRSQQTARRGVAKPASVRMVPGQTCSREDLDPMEAADTDLGKRVRVHLRGPDTLYRCERKAAGESVPMICEPRAI